MGWNRLFKNLNMKRFKLIPVIALLIFNGNASAQISRKEMVSYYKMVFLFRCTDPFIIDTGFREEVCSCCPDGLDRKSYLEIDSTVALVGEEIWLDTKTINEESSGHAYPSRLCVIDFCHKHYESKDLDKMAKGFARRMKKVNPINYRKY